jgi:integrase
MKCNPRNERIKREYLEWQREAGRKSHGTTVGMRRAIERYERYTDYRDFVTFDKNLALLFKGRLLDKKSRQSGKPLSRATVRGLLRDVQTFYAWLCQRPGYKRIDAADIEYLNLSRKETAVALAPKLRDVPTLAQIRAAIDALPIKGETAKRDRALIAFAAVTGIRDGALVSLKLKHVRLEDRLVLQPGDEVNTKFSKTIYTYFFPVGEDLHQEVESWVTFLLREKLYGLEAPLFPRTALRQDANNCFTGGSLEPEHWATTSQVRKIFGHAFAAAGLPIFSPHSFRNTLTRLGQELCSNAAELKAWSQNLGHNDAMTTIVNYGHLDTHTQGEIISRLGRAGDESKNRPATVHDIERMMEVMRNNQ